MSVVATLDQPVAAADPPAAAAARPAATTAQLPRYNHRSAVNFDDHQIRNIQELKRRMGTTEMGVLRAAADTLAYLHGLSVQSDPSVYVNNFLVLANNPQNGGPHGQ